jgi:hypothetical protein
MHESQIRNGIIINIIIMKFNVSSINSDTEIEGITIACFTLRVFKTQGFEF